MTKTTHTQSSKLKNTLAIIFATVFIKSSLAYDNPSGTTVGPVTTADSSITNSGTITSSTGAVTGITSTGTTTTISINNGGTISITGSGGSGVETSTNSGTATTITNTGTITGSHAINLRSAGSSLTNSATGNIVGINGGEIVSVFSTNQTVTNNGVMTGSGSGVWGIYIRAAEATIINSNSISVSGNNSSGIYNVNSANTTITNTGTITATGTGAYGIRNIATIAALNNAQSGLTYTGVLPTNYNIIINSPTSFGNLAVTSVTGSTIFGIYTGSTVRNGTYASVLTGIAAGNLSNTSGTFGSASWLLSNSSGSIWDLIISGYVDPVVVPLGPSVANTNQSLLNTASALQGTYTLQNSVLANSFSYDCNVFGANNVCVSAGGRNTAVQAANGLNNTSALLIAAYRPHPNFRIGAYADQNLSVSNPGGTVNLGNNIPLIGLFGAWNERLDGTGTEVKVSAAYGQKNTTINRSVVGSGATASEAGSGSSTLNSQGVQATAKYGFGIIEGVIVSPYVGVRYTQNNMGGYTEGTSSSVTAPLTYSALNTNATTALAGVGASYRVIPTVTTFASAGVETDTNTANGTYAATNASIGALTPVNFNANPVRTRPTATLGAYYDVAKNQRLGVTGIYRQEPYQAVSTTTVLATYTIGM